MVGRLNRIERDPAAEGYQAIILSRSLVHYPVDEFLDDSERLVSFIDFLSVKNEDRGLELLVV